MTGFETYLGNFRVLKRMMKQMAVPCSLLSDPSEVLDTPADGHYRMYSGGTTQQEMKEAPDAIDTLLLQPWQLLKSKKVVQEMWNQPATEVAIPLGLAATDELLMTVSQLSGKPIADALTLERGRLVDMMLDSHTAARQEIWPVRRPGLRDGPHPLPAGAGLRADGDPEP